MKKLAFVLVVLVALLVGCGQKTVYKETTEEGSEVEVTGTAGTGEWCPEGGDWTATWTATEEAGAGTATWKVDKLMTSGKYAGLCHVIYTATTEQGTTTMDYYFSEDGNSGYYEITMPDGSKYSQEFHQE